MMCITNHRLFKIVEWAFFLGLCMVSLFFMKEVLEKYFSKDSSFKQYEEHITENPTITICFSVTVLEVKNGTKAQIIKDYNYSTQINIVYASYFVLNEGENYIQLESTIIF